MIEFLNNIDTALFLFLNELHSSWMDPIMVFISGKKEWIPLYLIFVIMIIKHFKWQAVWILLGIGLTITLSDQLASGFMKPFFARFRPSRSPELEGLVHIVNGYTGGKYGFASSHAANAFGLATFLWLAFREQYKWFVWIFVWATIVAYSRIYLGVHYPGDILVGAFIGISFGYLSFRLQRYAAYKWPIKR
jgi:undecaprenyl-diphosphatase